MVRPKRCPSCDSPARSRSRRRFYDYLLPWLRPFRCITCHRRFYDSVAFADKCRDLYDTPRKPSSESAAAPGSLLLSEAPPAQVTSSPGGAVVVAAVPPSPAEVAAIPPRAPRAGRPWYLIQDMIQDAPTHEVKAR